MQSNDLSNLCRVCLQLPEESQLVDLTTIYDEDAELSYGECFTICTKIDLQKVEQGVPHMLCKPCGLELQIVYDFNKKIEESNVFLLDYEKQLKNLVVAKEPEDLNIQAKLISCNNAAASLFNATSKPQQHTEHRAISSNAHEDNRNCNYVAETEPEPEPVPAPVKVEQQAQTSTSHLNTIKSMVVYNDDIDEACSNAETQNDNEDNVLSEQFEEVSEDFQSQNNELEADLDDNIVFEDYSNMETLEDEENYAMQIKTEIIKADENSVSQSNETRTNAAAQEWNEYEFTEFLHEADAIEMENQNASGIKTEHNNSEVEDQTTENNNDDEDDDTNAKTLDSSVWQDNVVAVANTEPIPVTEEEEQVEQMELVDHEEQEEQQTEQISFGDYLLKPVELLKKRHAGCYSCDVCHKEFRNHCRMVAHRRCHMEDRPRFTCQYCGKVYATKQAMESHVQTSHEKSGYSCTICNKVFAIRKSLEVHMRFHTGDFPFACNLCDKKFAQSCHLNTHKKVKHNNERFFCTFEGCGKFFTSSTSLRNHEHSHGVMPFECEFCKKGYPAKSKLKVHIKRKHSLDMNTNQLECMRKFFVTRSKLNIVKLVEADNPEEDYETSEMAEYDV